MAKDPSTVATKWSQNLSASGPSITAGVNAVTTPPGQAAAKNKAAWIQNTPAAADKWAANTSAVSLQEWQQATLTKGVPRISQGAAAAQPKMQQFMTKLLPFIDSARGSLQPRGGLEQNLARANDFARKMATFKK